MHRRNPPALLTAVFALALALVLAPPATAQPVVDPHLPLPFDAPEAWAAKYFTAVSSMSALGVADETLPGALTLAFEGGWVPSLDERERTVGFGGTKEEDLNKTSVFGRLRLDVGLPGDLTLTVGWVPPLEVGGAEPNVLTLSLARPLVRTEGFRLALRLTAQDGKIEGDFTCSAEQAAGDEPSFFDCEAASSDELTPRYAGLEIAAAFPRGRVEPYVAVEARYMDLEFQVDARYNGFIDRTRHTMDGWTWSAAAGLALPLGEKLSAAAEVFYTPLDVVRPPRTDSENDALLNARGLLRWRLR